MSLFHHKKKINTWVAYAPVLFFIALLIGIGVHLFFPEPFIEGVAGNILGFIMLATGSVIIYFALKARHTLYTSDVDNLCSNYDEGPYRWSRHPGYIGFFLLIIGLAFVLNSLAMLVLAMVLGPIFTFIVIPAEEKILKKVCDNQYVEYQKRVRMWF